MNKITVRFPDPEKVQKYAEQWGFENKSEYIREVVGAFNDFGEAIDHQDIDELPEVGPTDIIGAQTELLLEDEDYRAFILDYIDGDVESLRDFYENEVDALDGMADALIEETSYLDAEEVDDALARLLEGLYERDGVKVNSAAREFGDLNPDLGVTAAFYAGKFANDYWQQSAT